MLHYKNIFTYSFLFFILFLFSLCGSPLIAAEKTNDSEKSFQTVVVGQISDQAITPVTVRYLRRVKNLAEENNAECILIELDTPGGLMKATQTIVKNIINSQIPVIVYVTPSGGRAASAGVFITYSANVAAMAPATHIGAAHPVKMGGSSGGLFSKDQSKKKNKESKTEGKKETSDTNKNKTALKEKQLNDAVAWINSLATLRGRNAEWGEKAVSESVSITAEKAVEKNVVDLLASNKKDLFQKLDGQKVTIGDNKETLNLTNTNIVYVKSWWGEEILHVLSNPNLAFIFLILGFYGMLFELYTAGWGISGTVGIICLILGAFSLSILPINHAALALIIVALALFAGEAFVTSFGALTVGGLACLILGGLMLIDTPVEFMRVSASVVIPIAVATAFITVFIVTNVLKGLAKKVQTGDKSLVGEEVKSLEDFKQISNQYSGTVWAHGEYWNAVSNEPVQSDQVVEIEEREGLKLKVRPIKQDNLE